MSDIDIAGLRRLLSKAEPAPWAIDDDLERTRSLDLSIVSVPKACSVANLLVDDDAALIVALRNAAPELLDRLEAARKVVEAARGLAVMADITLQDFSDEYPARMDRLRDSLMPVDDALAAYDKELGT